MWKLSLSSCRRSFEGCVLAALDHFADFCAALTFGFLYLYTLIASYIHERARTESGVAQTLCRDRVVAGVRAAALRRFSARRAAMTSRADTPAAAHAAKECSTVERWL